MHAQKIAAQGRADAVTTGNELTLEELAKAVLSLEEADEGLINAIGKAGAQKLFGCTAEELQEACGIYNAAHRGTLSEIYTQRNAQESVEDVDA